MKLSDIARNQIDSSIRSRGKLYADWNQAKIISKNKNRIEAEVKGSYSNTYDVTIDIEPHKIFVFCSCPYFQSSGACKHIWATIVTAEKEGFSGEVIYPDSVLVERNLEEIDEDEEEFLEETKDPRFDKLKNYLKSDAAEPHHRTGQRDVYKYTKPGSSFQKPQPNWRTLFADQNHNYSQNDLHRSSQEKQTFYEIEGSSKVGLNDLIINIKSKKLKKDGQSWQTWNFEFSSENINKIRDETDRKIIAMLMGPNSSYLYNHKNIHLNPVLTELILPLAIETGRCYLSSYGKKELFLKFDKSRKWEFSLSLEKSDNSYLLKPFFKCDSESRKISEAAHVNSTGYVFWNDGTVNPLDAHHLYSWIQNFSLNTYTLSLSEARFFIHNFKDLEDRPPFNYPEELHTPEVCIEPQPLFTILDRDNWRRGVIFAKLGFYYKQHLFKLGDTTRVFYDQKENVFYTTNRIFHDKCLNLLYEIGVTEDTWSVDGHTLIFREKQLQNIVTTLLKKGWSVEGEGVQFKKPGNFSFSVNSGIDWFEVEGACEYDGEMVSIPEILDALKKKKEFIKLSDGSLGLMPSEWLEKYGRIVSMGTTEDESIKFKKSQTLLIDLLLADQPLISCDSVFKSIRDSLKNFSGITPVQECGNFTGELRNYQREGLGWLSFLQQFGFGGCLADDMGLGKTIQVLSILEKQRFNVLEQQNDGKGKKKIKKISPKVPSLVVAPRSLIYNWYNEASKFTPDLEVLDHSHSQRTTEKPDFSEFDLVLVTYGTLRRDIEALCKTRFNYVILDEAQAIKNANTATAKAVRLLNGVNRLALSGTPVENHLSDLWSIFEFLNPGILGSASVFKGASKSKSPDENECQLLRKALRPFILRRSKSQVAVDLPEKTEKLILCQMEGAQKIIYDQLKQYYQASLIKTISKSGLNRSKIQILEALLRLRQAACHPGLIDKNNTRIESSKLETLLAQLQELKEGGHKCLVFSQFTSMLAIIRDKLTENDIRYEYLDGSTRKRQSVIERFQDDPDCSTFLISLKAGGVGLNLTSADYVFIFDPWWNPAAEMQAIDRTHRIGQTKPVFAYKLICKDTVEEKILQLQKSKQFLAESVITTDESVLSSITSEELQMLLS